MKTNLLLFLAAGALSFSACTNNPQKQTSENQGQDSVSNQVMIPDSSNFNQTVDGKPVHPAE